jgi:SAM-dependent methyltransferase
VLALSKKPGLHTSALAVSQHYETDAAFEYERDRLTGQSPAEFAITERCISKWVTEFSTVADIGVGCGHYAEFVARRHCRIYLTDVSNRFLEATASRLQEAGLANNIAGVCHASAVQIYGIDASSCDAVLMLGPFYHLGAIEERHAAVREANRILKPGGILFGGGINRLAYFRDLLRDNPIAASARKSFHDRFMVDGNLNPAVAPGIGFAHLTTIGEFRSLFSECFDEIAMLGVESFAAALQPCLGTLPVSERDAWLDIIERTCGTLEGLAASDHFLFVGRKRMQGERNGPPGSGHRA